MAESDMAPRTVTVPTCDHGVVTIPEPDWCTGEYHQPGGFRVDITHSSADEEFRVPTSRGTVVLLRTCISQYPFTELSRSLEPFISVELDGDWHRFEPHELGDLADAIGWIGGPDSVGSGPLHVRSPIAHALSRCHLDMAGDPEQIEGAEVTCPVVHPRSGALSLAELADTVRRQEELLGPQGPTGFDAGGNAAFQVCGDRVASGRREPPLVNQEG